jgi:hypothetical protein
MPLRGSFMTVSDTRVHSEQFVSVKTLAKQWDCSRTTVTRLLEQAGVKAYYFGHGRTGSKRYLKDDIDRFLAGVERA